MDITTIADVNNVLLNVKSICEIIRYNELNIRYIKAQLSCLYIFIGSKNGRDQLLYGIIEILLLRVKLNR